MRKIAIILVCLLALCGCSKDETSNGKIVMNLAGKSQSWEVAYEMVGDQKQHESNYVFSYIGGNLKDIKNVEYEIDGPTEGETGRFSLDESGIHYGKMKETGGLPTESSRDTIIKLVWNDKQETIVLKKVKDFEKFSGKLGIILKDTKLQDPYVVTVDENGENVFQTMDGEATMKQNDLAVCIAETEKGYVVEAVGGDLPRPRGFIDKDVLSFDEKQFIKANQGSIYQAMTYSEINGKELGESTAVVRIIKREGEWLQIEIPGMGAPVWIKSSSLEYKIETSGIDINHTLGN